MVHICADYILVRLISKTHYADSKLSNLEGATGPMIHRSPFDDPTLLAPLHPLRGSPWQLAMMACNVQRPHPSVPWGFWCPDPATLLRGELLRQRCVFWRWLKIRGDWLYCLDQSTFAIISPALEPLRPQAWRDLLMATSTQREPTTKAAQRRAVTLAGLDKHFTASVRLESEDVRWWRGRKIDSAQDIQENELSEMAWEMAEVNFRVEILHLDYALCMAEVKANESETERRRLAAEMFVDHSPVVPTLPRGQEGLVADQIRARAPFLEAFRVMMTRWASCPTTIKNAQPLTGTVSEHHIEHMESCMILYYVQTFWESSGRAPQVPLRFPFGGVS